MTVKLLSRSFALFVTVALASSANVGHSSVLEGPPDEADEMSSEFIAQRLAVGQIVAVDRAAGTITLRHEPIPDVFMTERMTMIFRVADKTMLKGLTAGDKVRFAIRRDGRSYTVVRIENSN